MADNLDQEFLNSEDGVYTPSHKKVDDVKYYSSTPFNFGNTRLIYNAITGNLNDPPETPMVTYEEVFNDVKKIKENILQARDKGPELTKARSLLDRKPIVTEIDYETADAEGEIFDDEEAFDWKKDALSGGSAWASTAAAYEGFRIKETGDPTGALTVPYQGLLIEDLYTPEAMSIIREYEKFRTGKTNANGYSDEELVRNFLTNERHLADLNLQKTAYHMQRTMTGSEQEAIAYAKGALLYDYLGSAFDHRNSSSDKRKAIKDHFVGTVTSIENIVAAAVSVPIKMTMLKTLQKSVGGRKVLYQTRRLFSKMGVEYKKTLSLAENIQKSGLSPAKQKSLLEAVNLKTREIERNILSHATNSEIMKQTKKLYGKELTLGKTFDRINNRIIWTAGAIDGIGARTSMFHDPNRPYSYGQNIAMSLVGFTSMGLHIGLQAYGKAASKLNRPTTISGTKETTQYQEARRLAGNFLFNEFLENKAKIEARAAKVNVNEVVDPTNATKWAGAEAKIKLNKIKFSS